MSLHLTPFLLSQTYWMIWTLSWICPWLVFFTCLAKVLCAWIFFGWGTWAASCVTALHCTALPDPQEATSSYCSLFEHKTCSYLGVTKSVLGVVHINGSKELLRSLLAIHKLSFWDSTRIKHSVSVGGNKIWRNTCYWNPQYNWTPVFSDCLFELV